MIIYATKQTIERYGLPDHLHPEGNVVPVFAGRDVGNPLQEWGAKLFYFNRRFNFDYIITDKIDGKTKYFMPNERFRELVLAEYGA